VLCTNVRCGCVDCVPSPVGRGCRHRPEPEATHVPAPARREKRAFVGKVTAGPARARKACGPSSGRRQCASA
jgi:hypothetical protein